MFGQKILPKYFAVAAILAASLSPAHAGAAAGLARSLGNVDAVKRIEFDRTTLAPFSYMLFCQNHPTDCSGGAGSTIVWSKQTKLQVEQINRRVNHAMHSKTDVADVWSVDTRSGDCEDFALTKRRALVSAGFAASSLQMAVARTRSGEEHAVLVARTSKGDLVLDNRNDTLQEWYRTDLFWTKIASAENPRIWHAIN